MSDVSMRAAGFLIRRIGREGSGGSARENLPSDEVNARIPRGSP